MASRSHALPLENLYWAPISDPEESPGVTLILKTRKPQQTNQRLQYFVTWFSIIMYYNQNVYLNKEKPTKQIGRAHV